MCYMKIKVYCKEETKKEIGDLVPQLFPAAEYLYVDYENIGLHEGALIIDHLLVSTLKQKEYSGYSSVFIYYKGQLFDIRDTADFLEKRRICTEKEDWMKAKDINEVLMDIDFLNQNKIHLSYPAFFQIESTDICNSRCIMCDHYFNHNKNARILSTETLMHMRDAIQMSRIVNLNGMGEPFVSPAIKEQIDLYVGYGDKIVANTNLSILDEELISRIEKDFEWLAISVDGARKETYESIRIGLSYEKLMQNLNWLKERAPAVKKIISMVIMRQNVCEMPEMVALAQKVGIDQVVFLNLNPNLIIGNLQDVMFLYPKVVEYYSVKAIEKGRECGVTVIVANAQNLDFNIRWEDIQEELEKMRSIPLWKTQKEEEQMEEISAIIDHYKEEHDLYQDTTIPSKVRCSGVCDWILKNCYTNLYGDISMCCRNLIYRAGRVEKEGDFLSVWNAPLMQKTREIFYSGYLPESCLKCGMIEGGELEFLKVDLSPEFYQDSEIKKGQKIVLKELLGGHHGL